MLLSNAYGGDIDSLDALTGALAEDIVAGAGGVFGELFHVAWVGLLYRAFIGDRLHHLHARPIEDAGLTTLSDVIERTVNVTDLPLAVFQALGVTVCGKNCGFVEAAKAELSGSYGISWKVG